MRENYQRARENYEHNKTYISEKIPLAPDFYLVTDSHYPGYHCHLCKSERNKRVAIRITYDSNSESIFVERHGRGDRIDISNAVRFVRKNLIDVVKRELGEISEEKLARPGTKAIKVPRK